MSEESSKALVALMDAVRDINTVSKNEARREFAQKALEKWRQFVWETETPDIIPFNEWLEQQAKEG